MDPLMALRVGHHRLTSVEQWYWYGKYADRAATLGLTVVTFSFWKSMMESYEGDLIYWNVVNPGTENQRRMNETTQ